MEERCGEEATDTADKGVHLDREKDVSLGGVEVLGVSGMRRWDTAEGRRHVEVSLYSGVPPSCRGLNTCHPRLII